VYAGAVGRGPQRYDSKLTIHHLRLTSYVSETQIKLVERGDTQIEYYVQGRGPLVVLLPSLGRDRRRQQVRRLRFQ
jgi:hypothetical protein